MISNNSASEYLQKIQAQINQFQIELLHLQFVDIEGSLKPKWEVIMIARNRRQIALCARGQ
jgi:hypothetical protein